MTTTELQRMSVTRLREVARERQIPGRSRMKREALIEALDTDGARRKSQAQPDVEKPSSKRDIAEE